MVYTSSGTITKYLYAQTLDTINYNPGFYQTIDSIVGIDYSSYLYSYLQDTCDVQLYSRESTVAPFRFDIYYNTSVKSVAIRDQILQLPFAQGINMAHNRLQDIVIKLK